MILSARSCYRSVYRHPFLVGMAFLLIFLYRSFPFLFSLFVSASPVIVSTAVLLATLLSFGQPNIPEMEKEETITTTTSTHNHKFLKSTGFLESDSFVVSKDRGFDDETKRYYTEKEQEQEMQEEVETSVVHKEAISNVDDRKGDYSLADEGASVVMKEISLQRATEEAPVELVGRGFEHESSDYLNEEKMLSGQQVIDNHYSQIQQLEDEEESAELDKDKLPEGSVGVLDARGGSAWKHVGQGADDDDDGDDGDDDEEASDSGSDGAESSSPDASMADIIPMLDELHPLLDEDPPQTAHMSHDGSDAPSEHSLESSDSTESDDDIVNHEEFEVGEDEEEEETHADKEDETKSAITWTEDDQKNLMNLGTSELERNQRLENLIARRRARKNMRMMAEKNLIDLESADLPFHIAPISTARHNPFDLPYDSNDNIPGSAPSILLPRRNPFDLPYDSSEEKPDLAGDTFQQDFVTFHQPKDSFFRRHESFNVGPSIFGAPRQERQEIKLRPYFVPERMAVEGTSYSSFQRQSSEVSESKMSSVPDTESMGSAGDLEDMRVTEEDLSQEPVLISVAEHASDLVGHGSQSSGDVETVELGQVKNRDVELEGTEVRLGYLEDHHEVESSFSELESEATPRELNINEIHLKTEGVEQEQSSRSSSSSLSEINEEIAIEKEGEGLSNLEKNSNYPHIDPSISVQPLMKPENNFSSLLVEESQQKEPVYDSSPPAVKKTPSSSSFSADLQAEVSQMGLPTVLINKSNSFAEMESEASDQGLENETPDNDVSQDSSERDEIDDSELGSRSLTDVSKHDVLESGISVMEDRPHNDESSQYTQDQLSSGVDLDLNTVVHQGVGKEEFTDFSSQTKYIEEQNLVVSDMEEHSLAVEQISPILLNTFSPETESIELRDKEVILQFEQVHSSYSDVKCHEGVYEVADEKLVSTYQSVSDEKNTSQPEKEFSLPETSRDESPSENPENQLAESDDEPSTIKMEPSEFQEMDNKVQPDNNFPSTHEPAFHYEATRTEAPPTSADLRDVVQVGNHDLDQDFLHWNFSVQSTESHFDMPNNIEDVDEIKEIDENLLLELDTVGDFSVKDLGSNLGGIEKHMFTDGESFLEEHDLETKSFGAVNGSSSEVCEAKVEVDAEDHLASGIEDEISNERDAGVRELQISRTGSIKGSIEVDSPENIESRDIESSVQESMTAAAAMPDLVVKSPKNIESSDIESSVQETEESRTADAAMPDLGAESSSSEGSSSRVFDVKGEKGKSPKSSSRSSSSDSEDE